MGCNDGCDCAKCVMHRILSLGGMRDSYLMMPAFALKAEGFRHGQHWIACVCERHMVMGEGYWQGFELRNLLDFLQLPLLGHAPRGSGYFAT